MKVRDTIAKVRALVSMKTALISALQIDLTTAARRITFLEVRVEELERESAWWQAQDEEMGRREADGLTAKVEVAGSSDPEDQTFEEGIESSWPKGTHQAD